MSDLPVYGRHMAYDPDAPVKPQGMVPPYQQLAGILAARIRRGDWKGDDQPLPSIDHLRQQYGLSRNTVRKAVALLVAEGLVVVVPQRGTYVRGAGDDGPAGDVGGG